MAQRLTLVCCGPTAALKRGVFARDDEPLDDRAAQGLTFPASIRGAAEVWTGPALRALQTAGLLDVKSVVMNELREQDFGAWIGKSLKDIEKTEPDLLSAWLVDPDACPPGGEAFAAVMERAASVLAEAAGEASHIVAITHPAVIRATILQILGASAAAFNRIDVEPFGMTDLRHDGRRWRLRATGIPARSATAG